MLIPCVKQFRNTCTNLKALSPYNMIPKPSVPAYRQKKNQPKVKFPWCAFNAQTKKNVHKNIKQRHAQKQKKNMDRILSKQSALHPNMGGQKAAKWTKMRQNREQNRSNVNPLHWHTEGFRKRAPRMILFPIFWRRSGISTRPVSIFMAGYCKGLQNFWNFESANFGCVKICCAPCFLWSGAAGGGST